MEQEGVYIHRGETLEVPKNVSSKDFILEVNFELLPENEAKIDVGCALFDEQRLLRETVNIFQPQNSNETGTGAICFMNTFNSTLRPKDKKVVVEEGNDTDRIRIMVSKLDPFIKALMIAVTTNTDFQNVDSANISLYQTKAKPLFNFSLACQGKHSALLLCCLFRGDDDIWYCKNIGDATIAKHVRDMEGLMAKHLKQLMIERTVEAYSLSNGDAMDIPETTEKLMIEFGWKSSGSQAHCSIMLFDTQGGNPDDVYYLNKSTTDGSIQYIDADHSQKRLDLTETYKVRDVEKFVINLPRVAKNVNVLVGAITVYSVDEDALANAHQKDLIARVYTKFFNAATEKELYNYVPPNFGSNNSQITFKLFRKGPFEPNKWKIQAIGEPSKVTSVLDLIPEVQSHWIDDWSQLFKWKKTVVSVISATGLRTVSPGSKKPSPYAKVIIDREEGLSIKSDIDKKTINPTWDFRFEMDDPSVLEIEILHDGLISDTFLGRVLVDVNALPLDVQNDIFMPLQGKGKSDDDDSKVTGSIHLKLLKKKEADDEKK